MNELITIGVVVAIAVVSYLLLNPRLKGFQTGGSGFSETFAGMGQAITAYGDQAAQKGNDLPMGLGVGGLPSDATVAVSGGSAQLPSGDNVYSGLPDITPTDATSAPNVLTDSANSADGASQNDALTMGALFHE